MREVEDMIDDFMEEEEDVFRYSITSYGVDYTVDRIVDRLNKGAILIPEFQRKYVWSLKDASRFIESLILGLPVPGVFFSQEKGTNKMLVIDGQQRLKSLQFFYSKKFGGQLFKLKGVQADLEGKTIDDLDSNDRIKLDDCVIHATVIKQDAPTDDNSSIYMIFERLNTGGMKLFPQEVRACIYHGPFNEILAKLANDENWKRIYAAENTRLKSEELILRFLTLNESYQNYKRGFKGFLNGFMERYQNASDQKLKEFESLFCSTIKVIYDNIGENAFRLSKYLNAAVYDSVMIGISKRLVEVGTVDGAKLRDCYTLLLNDRDYRGFVESNTASEVSLKGRINKAIETFKDI
ncbi:MAG: DUF262 domain-containing protein [Muribaculaceae bacterium]|jgi:Uncharacterized conserved protein